MHELKEIVALLPYCALVGLTSAYFAKSRKGRRPLLWFFIGFSFGILGLTILFFLPKIKPPALEPPTSFSRPSISRHGDWYYINEFNLQVGPISFQELVKNKRGADTYVWHEQFMDWKKFGDVFKE